MSKKKIAVISSAAAVAVVLIVTLSLVFTLGAASGAIKADGKAWDAVDDALGNLRVVKDGGKSYLATASGKKLSKGYYDMQTLGFDMYKPEKQSAAFFKAKLDVDSGWGVIDKKGKLLTKAGNDKTFEFGGADELQPLYIPSPYANVLEVGGFLAKRADKYFYLSKDGIKGAVLYDAATPYGTNMFNTHDTDCSFLAEIISGDTVTRHIVNADGSFFDCGANAVSLTNRSVYSIAETDGSTKLISVAGKALGAGVVKEVRNALCLIEYESGKLKIADAASGDTLDLGAVSSYSASSDYIIASIDGKTSLYGFNAEQRLAKLTADYDNYFDLGGASFLGITGQTAEIVKVDNEKIALCKTPVAATVTESGLPADVTVEKTGDFIILSSGNNYLYYKDFVNVAEFTLPDGATIDSLYSLTFYTAGDGQKHIYSAETKVDLTYESYSNNVLGIKNGDVIDYYIAPEGQLLYKTGEYASFIKLESLPAAETPDFGSFFSEYAESAGILNLDFKNGTYDTYSLEFNLFGYTRDGKSRTFVEAVGTGVSVIKELSELSAPTALSIQADRDVALTANGAIIRAVFEGKTLKDLTLSDNFLSEVVITSPTTEGDGLGANAFVTGKTETGGYGAWNGDGKLVVNAVYDGVKVLNDKLAAVKKGLFWAVLDMNGEKADKLITDFVYSEVSLSTLGDCFFALRVDLPVYDCFDMSGKIIAKKVSPNGDFGPDYGSDFDFVSNADFTSVFDALKSKNGRVPIATYTFMSEDGKITAYSAYVSRDNVMFMLLAWLNF